MPLFIIGELSADRAHIILMAAGHDVEVAAASRQMQLCTPHAKASKPAGGLVVPLSWGATVQLASTFGHAWKPQPRLAAWIAEQITARLAADVDQAAWPEWSLPAGLVPRSYQLSAATMLANQGGGLLFDEMGPQPVDTPIYTPTGWTWLGKLVPGDVVFNVHGRPTPVRAIKHFGEQPVYRVHFNDRTSTLATAQHLWQVYTVNDRFRGGAPRVFSTAQLLEAGLHNPRGYAKWFLPDQPVLAGIETPDLPLDPYAYGALLGDGATGGEHLSLTSLDDHILTRVVEAASAVGTSSRRNVPVDRCEQVRFHRTGLLGTALAALDARVGAAHKHVDPRYLYGGEATRRAVLAGLLDTDGSATHSAAAVEFSSASPQLSRDVAWLGRSLGAVVTESSAQPAGYHDKNGEHVECLPKYRLSMRFPADGPNPFTLPRKVAIWAEGVAEIQRKRPTRCFRAIEAAGTADVCCIELETDDDNARVYLTDETLIPTHNTGKTVSAILGVRELERLGRDPFPCVVVSPASVVDGWVEHFRNWMPGVRVVAWRGTPERRRELIGLAEVYVSSYDTARNDARTADRRESPLLALGARLIIADEMHRLKTRSAKQSQAVRRLAKKAEFFIGLSGTPITHHPGNLWPALVCLEPTAWPSYDRWANRYLQTIPGDYGETVLGLAGPREPEFRLGLLGQTRRVAKADVLTELPPKIYSVRTVALPPQWRRVYDAMESDMLAALPDGEELSVMGVLAQLTRLSQLACAPADVETTVDLVDVAGRDEEIVHVKVSLKAPSWKVDALLDVLEERCDPGGGGQGEQVVVFAPSRQLIMLAGEAATAAGYRVGYIVGGQSMAARTETIARFQRGTELDVLCVTTAAGGEGITLTAARTCVFLQRPWSMGEAVQCEDRLHRIGAERHDSIEVIDIVASNTIDTRVRAVIREKGKQFSDLVQDPRVVETLLGGAGVSRRKVEGRDRHGLRVVS